MKMPEVVQTLVDTLADERDHPEIWKAFENAAQSERDEVLAPLVAYMKDLLAIPQEEKTGRLLSVLASVGEAHAGSGDKALAALQYLKSVYDQSELVTGALRHVEQAAIPAH